MFFSRYITANKWVALGGIGLILLGVLLSLLSRWHGQRLQVVMTTDQHMNVAASQYTVQIAYPQLQKTATNSQKVANQLVKSRMQQIKDNFAMQVATQSASSGSHLLITYQIITATSSLWSLQFREEVSSSDSAHPEVNIIPFNYSFATNKEITLRNLFNRKTTYLPVISSLARKQLEGNRVLSKEEKQLIEEGTSPKEENFQKFVLTPTAIIFLFESYQVGPSSVGLQKVAIPYQDLKPYFSS